MKLFDGRRGNNGRMMIAAREYATQGGQGLHVWKPHDPENWPNAPHAFKRTHTWAHLFDQDIERLKRTAQRLGIRQIVIQRIYTKNQHIDLCSGPLARAIEECDD